jgi:thiol:disulfide interchange protein DsbG
LTLLTSVHALADSQCTPTPPVPMNASAPAETPAPEPQATAVIPAMPKAPPAPSVPDAATPSTPYPLPADRAAAAGLHEMTADEVAAIPGLKPIAAAGGRIFVMGRQGNTPDLVAFHEHDFQMLAPLSDPRYICRGVVSDEQGNNVSFANAVKVPGLVAPPNRPALKGIATPAEAIAAVAKATYGTLGPDAAPKVWVVVDPLCSHSQDTIRALIPHAQAGRIQLNILPVDAFGQTSAKAVHVLLSEAPDHMIQRWFQPGMIQSSYAPDAEAKFKANHMILAGLLAGPMHVTGVPEVLWVTRDGQAHAQQGLDVPNVPAFLAGLGN